MTLRAHPGAGDRAVPAVLAGAGEAVAACIRWLRSGHCWPLLPASELLGRLDDREKTVLAEVYRAQPISLAALPHDTG